MTPDPWPRRAPRGKVGEGGLETGGPRSDRLYTSWGPRPHSGMTETTVGQGEVLRREGDREGVVREKKGVSEWDPRGSTSLSVALRLCGLFCFLSVSRSFRRVSETKTGDPGWVGVPRDPRVDVCRPDTSVHGTNDPTTGTRRSGGTRGGYHV